VIHLQSLWQAQNVKTPDRFPFNVPVIRGMDRLTFTRDVTFFVGENGSGKSTLLETIACAARLPTIGANDSDHDPTLAAMRELANHLKWAWTKKSHRGFYMRSEDFFGFAKRIAQIKADLAAELGEVQSEFAKRGAAAAGLASMPFERELAALREQYGDGLDAQSHGESYFKLFQARFVPDSLYLMDEPEAPLSPTRQLTLIAMIHQMIQHGAQFIIATHSPILLAYPNAAIWSFDNAQIQPARYEELEHVTVTKTFLDNPGAYLRHLLEE
jgi:predicted ATPase